MIEIVCPNCQARYQLPDGAIGPSGRNVSCSTCAHKWRAFAEPIAEAEEPAVVPAAAEQEVPAAAAPAAPEAAPPAPPASAPPAAPAAMAPPAAPAAMAPPAAAEAEPEVAAADPQDTHAAIAAAFGRAAPSAPAPEAAEASAAPEAADAPEAVDPTAPPPAPGTNEEQMAAIRQMLSDLKEAADSAPAAEPGEAPAAAEAPAPVGPSARRRAEEESNRDDLDARIDDVNMLAKMVKGEPTGSDYDAAKLRKRHEQRAKRLQRARERRKSSGAFLTGFTLVATVSAVCVGLYVLHPQIVATSPQMAPALNEYVSTVDRYRVELDEKTHDWRTWLTDRIGKLTGKEGKQG